MSQSTTAVAASEATPRPCQAHPDLPRNVRRRTVGGNRGLHHADRVPRLGHPHDPVEPQLAVVRRVSDREALVTPTKLIEREWPPADELVHPFVG